MQGYVTGFRHVKPPPGHGRRRRYLRHGGRREDPRCRRIPPAMAGGGRVSCRPFAQADSRGGCHTLLDEHLWDVGDGLVLHTDARSAPRMSPLEW